MIDLVATSRHYLEHLIPVWEELGDLRGEVYLGSGLTFPGARPLRELEPGDDLILVAGYADLQRVGGRKAVLMEHGSGQSYGGDPDDPAMQRHPHYAGGVGRHNVVAFLCPNEHSAARNREFYPEAIVEVVGSPHLASLQGLERVPGDGRLTVAFAFHYDLQLCPETMNAWTAFWPAVTELAADPEIEVLGHAHPRIYRDLAPTYREWCVEAVPEWEQVLARADVLVADNTSVAFEFAAIVGPLVLMDAPWYRPWINHGLRFWDASGVGIRVGDPAGVALALEPALRGAAGKERALDLVYPGVENPAQRAAEVIERAVREADRVPARGFTKQMAAALRWA